MVPPEGAWAIIDMGHEKSTVTICHGRRLGYIRAISLAGRALTGAISSKMSVPADEAEKMKIEMGRVIPASEEEGLDDLTRGVAVAIRGVVDEFLLHLRQTLFTFREGEGVPVEGVYLCGGTSRLPGIDRYISDALKLNVKPTPVQQTTSTTRPSDSCWRRLTRNPDRESVVARVSAGVPGLRRSTP